MNVYVTVDSGQNITDYYTSKKFAPMIEVIQDDPVIDVSKLGAYKVERKDDGKDHLVFDASKWAEVEAKQKKEQAFVDGTNLLNDLATAYVLESASDEDAYKMRYLYELWKPETEYKIGDRRQHKDNLYKCKQNHTSEKQFTPDLIPALWDIVGDDNRGTESNPIIIPEDFSSMEYVKGKYYLEGDVLYIMNREGMDDGETVSLTYKPSALVGQYFEIVEQE